MDETQTKIIDAATRLFADVGYDGLSMRLLAKKSQIVPSVLYYYFKDKDALLKAMYLTLTSKLDLLLSQQPKPKNTEEMLRQYIQFQFDHAEEIVAVFKYYVTYRKKFPKHPDGFLPEKLYASVEELLTLGTKTGELRKLKIRTDAKHIVHMIHGFLLEYYPAIPTSTDKTKCITTLHSFIWRAIQKIQLS